MNPTDPATFFALAAVGAVAGGINAVAGGGSLLSFPALVFGVRLPSDIANATNSVALWPGSLGGAIGLWSRLPEVARYLRSLIVPTLAGSALGAQLFVWSGVALFDRIVPFLILFAAGLLFAQPRIKRWLAERGHAGVPLGVGMAMQFLVALYGGYFGAGMGIMMQAAFALFMDADLHQINAIKNWLGVLINIAASGMFIAQGLVDWAIALPLGLGAVIGGFLAARVSMRLDPDQLRTGVAVYGVGLGLYYFARSFLGG